MAKTYRRKYGDTEGTIGEIMFIDIDRAPDYHDGELESLKRKVEKMQQFMRCIGDALRGKARDELADIMDLEEIEGEE